MSRYLLFAQYFRNLGNFCLWNPESWALESGIQLKESRIPLKVGIRNPWRGIQKPRLPWIALHGVHVFFFKKLIEMVVWFTL